MNRLFEPTLLDEFWEPRCFISSCWIVLDAHSQIFTSFGFNHGSLRSTMNAKSTSIKTRQMKRGKFYAAEGKKKILNSIQQTDFFP